MELLVPMLIVACVLLLLCVFGIILVMRDGLSTKGYVESNNRVLLSVMDQQVIQTALINKLGHTTSDLTNTISDLLDNMAGEMSNRPGAIFKTKDGKYTATSWEELITRIRNDGMEDKYFSQKDIDELKNMFESEEDDDDEEDTKLF